MLYWNCTQPSSVTASSVGEVNCDRSPTSSSALVRICRKPPVDQASMTSTSHSNVFSTVSAIDPFIVVSFALHVGPVQHTVVLVPRFIVGNLAYVVVVVLSRYDRKCSIRSLSIHRPLTDAAEVARRTNGDVRFSSLNDSPTRSSITLPSTSAIIDIKIAAGIHSRPRCCRCPCRHRPSTRY